MIVFCCFVRLLDLEQSEHTFVLFVRLLPLPLPLSLSSRATAQPVGRVNAAAAAFFIYAT